MRQGGQTWSGGSVGPRGNLSLQGGLISNCGSDMKGPGSERLSLKGERSSGGGSMPWNGGGQLVGSGSCSPSWAVDLGGGGGGRSVKRGSPRWGGGLLQAVRVLPLERSGRVPEVQAGPWGWAGRWGWVPEAGGGGGEAGAGPAWSGLRPGPRSPPRGAPAGRDPAGIGHQGWDPRARRSLARARPPAPGPRALRCRRPGPAHSPRSSMAGPRAPGTGWTSRSLPVPGPPLSARNFSAASLGPERNAPPPRAPAPGRLGGHARPAPARPLAPPRARRPRPRRGPRARA